MRVAGESQECVPECGMLGLKLDDLYPRPGFSHTDDDCLASSFLTICHQELLEISRRPKLERITALEVGKEVRGQE